MKTNLFKWLEPIFFALLLFLCIRMAGDIPGHQSYWQRHSLEFILKEIIPIIIVSYLMIAMESNWMKWCRKKCISKWIEYGLVVLCTLLGCAFVMLISRWINGRVLYFYELPMPMVVSSLFVSFFYSFLRSQHIQKVYEAQQLQLEKMKNDQLRTELKFLKAQYHPHFLFNALNTVYFQIDEKNEAPRHTLETLSNLLRYQLYNEGSKVTVLSEINYLKQYISLWKLRSSEKLRLQVFFDEALQTQEIYPLLFVPLVENAFKYVSGEYRIALEMQLIENKLRFHVENSLSDVDWIFQKKWGIGIENLRRRLDLLYPGCYTLDIRREKTKFEVELIIKI